MGLVMFPYVLFVFCFLYLVVILEKKTKQKTIGFELQWSIHFMHAMQLTGHL